VLLRNYRKDGTPYWNDLWIAPVRNEMGRVVQYVGIQQDVTEREQAMRRVTTEASIIRALAESPTLQEAAPRLLRAICETQEWDVGTFWRLDPRTGTLRCLDFWHAADLEVSELSVSAAKRVMRGTWDSPGTSGPKGSRSGSEIW